MAKSKRIEFLASLLDGYDTVLDIGTDHGYVLYHAFKKGYIKHAIASDLREMPLLQAKKTLKDYPVTYRLSDGFLNIDETYDAAIIAGMGAYLMSEILEYAPKNDIDLILQANEKHAYLRKKISELGFKIIDEFLIFDGFYYVIIKIRRGHMHISESDLYLGPILKTKPESKAYYQKKVDQIHDIIKNLSEAQKVPHLHILSIYQSILSS